jgi:8-oxo-dGTP pyrophosphatase MutT (NUDIX family)
MLQKYLPLSSEELSSKDRMLSFLKQHDDCFERSLDIGHFTGSSWLVNCDNTKALLMHHTKLDKWLQLGGHCDGDPDILAVAIKEAQEESGLQNIVAVNENIFDIDVHLIPAKGSLKEHYHYDVRFLLRVTCDEKIIQNHESKELRWIGKSVDDLPTNEPSVVRMFDKWKSSKIVLVGDVIINDSKES